jgi:uncharacterized membrane protein YccF (DUF307 family)
MAMKTTTVTQAPHILLRFLWFVFIGWWLSGVWTVIAWVLCVSVIGLPLGVLMLNMLPQVTTLRARDIQTQLDERGVISVLHTPQLPMLIRAIYFVVVGWWLSALWLSLAWACGSTVLLLPVSFWMINRTPGILLLTRN